MDIHEIAEGLGKRLGIEITVSAEGNFSLTVDDLPLAVQTVTGTHSVILTAPVGAVPPEHLEGLYATLLKANYQFTATAGATLSLHPESGEVVLCRHIDLRAVDADEFLKDLGTFVNTLDPWRETVREFRAMNPHHDAHHGHRHGHRLMEGFSHFMHDVLHV